MIKLFVTFVTLCVVTCRGISENIFEDTPENEFAETLEPRIAGGQLAKPNQFPYMVSFAATLPPRSEYEPELHLWCGGSLISEQYILTAAHCLYSMSDATIMIGAHDIRAPEEHGRITVKVTKKDFIIHSDYKNNLSRNDIALIRLPGKVPLSDKIKVIQLPKRTNENLEGRLITAAGWGKKGDLYDVSYKLRFVKLQVLDNFSCRLWYPKTFNHEKMICIDGARRKSVCQGDSGGPIVLDGEDGSETIVGITSYGRGDCQKGYPTVFTRLTAYLDWIKENTGLSV